MRAMSATGFTGYGDLKLVDLPKPEVADGKVLVRVTAAGVTPLDHTILSGHYPVAKVPLVLGNEGAGTVEDGGGTAFPAGSRVMFTGPYGVAENGTYSEWLAVRREHLCLIPDGVDDVTAAGVPVAYLTAQITAGIHDEVIDSVDEMVVGDNAKADGIWGFKMPGKNGEDITLRGYWSASYVKIDGGWKLNQLTTNTTPPAQ